MDKERRIYLSEKIKEITKLHEHFVNKHEIHDTAALLVIAVYVAEIADAVFWQLQLPTDERMRRASVGRKRYSNG